MAKKRRLISIDLAGKGPSREAAEKDFFRVAERSPAAQNREDIKRLGGARVISFPKARE
jgi:hypothetical protein